MIDRIELLKEITMCGRCYKKDIALVIQDECSSVTTTLKKLIDNEYLMENKIHKEYIKDEQVKVISITNKGRAWLSDKTKEDYWYTVGNQIQVNFDTSDLKTIHRRLLDNRLKLLLDKSGVKVFECDKPSLSKILKDEIDVSGVYQDENYNKSIFETGVFYTTNEIRRFMSMYEERKQDVLSTFRIKGILIVHNTLYFVYASNVEKNTTVSYSLSVENRGISYIKQMLHSLKLNDKENRSIIVTNTESLLVDIAIAGKRGTSPRAKDRGNNTRQLLDCNSTIYQRVYEFSFTPIGIQNLKYFISTPFDKWQNDSRKLFEYYDNFSSIPKESIVRADLIGYDNLNRERIVYVPFVEAKFLKELHDMNYKTSILTYPSMADMISHIVRKDIAIFDITTGEPMNVQIYQDNGLPVDSIKELTKKPRRKPTYQIVLQVSATERKMMKRAAKNQNKSVSKYVKQYVLPHLQQDYDLAVRETELKREYNKQVFAVFNPKMKQNTDSQYATYKFDDIDYIDDDDIPEEALEDNLLYLDEDDIDENI